MSWQVRKGYGEYLRPAALSNDANVFTIELHHGGTFEWGLEIKYEGGKVGYIDNCHPNEMSYLRIISMASALGCTGVKRLFFKNPQGDLTIDLCELRLDEHAVRLMGYASSYRVVEVYCDCVGQTFPNIDSSEDDEEDDFNIHDEIGQLEEFNDSDEELGVQDENFPKIGPKKSVQKKTNVQATLLGGSKNKNVEDNEQQTLRKMQSAQLGEFDLGILDTGYASSDGLNSECDSDEDNGIKQRKTVVFSKNDLKNVVFEVGMKFGTGDEFKHCVKLYALQQFRDVYFDKNSKERMILYCADSNCEWKMRVTKLRDEETVQIKTLLDEHTCESALVNRSAKPKFIADMYLPQIKNNPWWKLKAFRAQVGSDLQISVTTSKRPL